MKKTTLKIHKWSGLIAGLFILLMGITGAVLVFHLEIQRFEHQDVWKVSNSAPIQIDKAYSRVSAKYPDDEIRLTKFSANANETLLFSVRNKAKHLLVFCHPSSGEIIRETDNSSTFLNWLLDLHYSLLAGRPGQIVVLLIGLVFLTSLITGVIVYRRALLKVIFFKVRIRNGLKRSSAAIHHYVGVWALLLNFLLVTTGILIAIDDLDTRPQASLNSPNPEINISIDQSLRIIRERYPEFTPTYIRFHASGTEQIRINGKISGDAFYWTQYYNEIQINPLTTVIAPLKRTSQAEPSKKFASIVGVIHLAEFDNILVKLLLCLAGLTAPILSVTGFIMWKKRQKS